MKRLILFLVCFMFLFGCGKKEELSNKIDKKESGHWQEIPMTNADSQQFISIQPLMEKINGFANFDQLNKTLEIKIKGYNYHLVYNVPVVQINGLLLPHSGNGFAIINNQAWLAKAFVNDILGVHTKEKNGKTYINLNYEVGTQEHQVKTEPTPLGDVEQVITLLEGFKSPIKGAQVDTIPSHLPSAKRTYRNGVHEGMDWYGFSSGITMNRQTKVYAMSAGKIVRADHEYNKYSSVKERDSDLQTAAEIGFTPTYILDKLRGRQVWIQYKNGLQARFAHLDKINPNLKVGDRVTADSLVGYVGNTGTSGDVKGDNSELHLHLDLLYRGELFWKGLSEAEIVKVLKTVFGD